MWYAVMIVRRREGTDLRVRELERVLFEFQISSYLCLNAIFVRDGLGRQANKTYEVERK